MDYESAVNYLYAQLPMFQRIGQAAYKIDLGNIVAMAEARGHPERAYPTVHIAGTNGKGSVSSMLASILMEAGYKTGLFTSPHLRSFTERIRIDGNPIPEIDVADFVTSSMDLMTEIQPSFFEVTAMMAFEHFKKQAVDIAVIEVGMGGRLDSTNIISPEVTAITNISNDHGQFLGDTIAKIAREKAGIMKLGVAAIIGQVTEETLPVFQAVAAEKGAKLILAEQVYQAKRLAGDLKSQSFEVSHLIEQTNAEYTCDLSGFYQRMNIPTVLSVVDALREKGWQISDEAVHRGIANGAKNSGFMGRMSLLQENPTVIADIGHNEAGVDEVLAQIEAISPPQLHIVWGMVNDKAIDKILKMMPKSAHYYFVKPDIPRGLDVLELQAQAAQFGLVGAAWPTVALGYAAALSAAAPEDLIYVGGSTFVVAEVI